MPKLCFERHEIFEALIKRNFLRTIPLKSCILKTLHVCFGQFATRTSSLFDSIIRQPHMTAPYSQRTVLTVSLLCFRYIAVPKLCFECHKVLDALTKRLVNFASFVGPCSSCYSGHPSRRSYIHIFVAIIPFIGVISP